MRTALTIKDKTVKVRGRKIQYRELKPKKMRRNGTDIVVLPGITQWLEVDKLPKLLARESRVMVLYWPGQGESEEIEHSRKSTAEAYAEILRDFITKKKLRKPHILANSFGTLIALTYAKEHDKSVSKLLLLGTPLLPAMLQNALVKRIPTLNGHRETDEGIPKKIVRFVFKTKPGSAALKTLLPLLGYSNKHAKAILSKMRKASPEAYVEMVKAAVVTDLRELLLSVSHPYKLIYGKKDPFYKVFKKEKLLRHLQNHTVLIEKAGHLPSLSNPEMLHRAVKHLLEH